MLMLRIGQRQSYDILHAFNKAALKPLGNHKTKRAIRSISGDHGVVTREESLSGASSALVLYNTLTREKDPILPMTTGNKGIACYCCGPTVYADAHLGHARTYVWFDMFRRVLESTAVAQQAPPPLFVMNITDVDDKILAAARQESHNSPLELAREFERRFWRDIDRLNCLRPHVIVRVTEHVDDSIIPYIQTLLEKGMAYKVDSETEGGVLFDVGAFERSQETYGKLVPNLRATDDRELDDIKVDHQVKRDHRDFALWKHKKQDESVFWDSPWGAGRPGWHIECSAMIESIQQQFPSHEFRVHAGGMDLKFPHHMNEIAQAEAYHHCCPTSGDRNHASKNEWIPHWMHTGILQVGGEKMSKSLKNFTTINSLLDLDEEWADDFRLWCFGLSGRYREATIYSPQRIKESRQVRTKLVRFLVNAERWVESYRERDDSSMRWSSDDVRFFDLVNTTRFQLRRALLDDLDGATCLNLLISLIEQGHKHMLSGHSRYEPVEAAIELVRRTLRLVGFEKRTYDAGLSGGVGASDNRGVLLDEFTKFRSTVRRAAIADHRDRTATDNMKRILKACDLLRTETLPTMGVELIDRSVKDQAQDDGWQYCIPRAQEGNPTKPPN